jgi:hypothetical protein
MQGTFLVQSNVFYIRVLEAKPVPIGLLPANASLCKEELVNISN